MTNPPTTTRRIAVIGGGISGLAAAHRLHELNAAAEVRLFEASDRLGGILQTDRRDGFLIERSADMFTTREPWALDLCRRIGFTDHLIETNSAFRKAFVVCRGRLIPVPEGFTLMSPAKVWPVLTTPILSPAGKLRLASEYFVPAKRDSRDESLESFALRRFGREAYERLIQPLIGGIYTADPAKLSMAATMAQFIEMEKSHGSLIRAMRSTTAKKPAAETRSEASGARYGLFVAPREGMASFIAAIAARLPQGCVQLNAGIRQLRQRADSRWELEIGGIDPAAPTKTEVFDAVIVATPAAQSSKLLVDADAQLADLIGRIPHAGAAVVVAGYEAKQFPQPPHGFGFVVPIIERRKILAGSFSSVKFNGRAPDGKVLMRTFIGGACQPELMRLSDDELKATMREELGELLGLRGEPLFADVVRWDGKMPQYHVGHLDLVAEIEARANQLANFGLAGNAYRGVGIPFCIHSGEVAAERVAKI